MKRLPWVLASVVMSVGACASSSTPSSTGKLTYVFVNIFGFGDARVGVMLIDRKGQHTGWNVDHAINQITGCGYEYGSEEGEPEENAPEDTTTLAPADTVPGHPEPTPKEHSFTITDSLGKPGLLSEGGCELRLDPVAGGHVTLAITGNVTGFRQCRDTTSVNVAPGVPSRWWLSWKASDDRCDVKVTRLTTRRRASHLPIK
jgi:hypothetical protein